MFLRIYVLASGSKGNALIVQAGDTRLLVDCGLSIRPLMHSLETIGLRPSRLDAILLTHEHSDHTRGLAPLLSRSKIPVFSSAGTLGYLKSLLPDNAELHPVKKEVSIGPLTVRAMRVPHDAAEPFAYHILCEDHKLTIASDLGEVTDELSEALQHSSCAVLESNHDEHLLDTGPYPDYLKRRIRSKTGHLSNRQTASALTQCRGNGLKHVVLAHLSEENNDPAIARTCAEEALAGTETQVHLTAQTTLGPFLHLE